MPPQGGLGLDPWVMDNVAAGDPPWLTRGIIVFILDLLNAIMVDVVYTDLFGVNLAEFLVRSPTVLETKR